MPRGLKFGCVTKKTKKERKKETNKQKRHILNVLQDNRMEKCDV
jgi:hypothetical protein